MFRSKLFGPKLFSSKLFLGQFAAIIRNGIKIFERIQAYVVKGRLVNRPVKDPRVVINILSEDNIEKVSLTPVRATHTDEQTEHKVYSKQSKTTASPTIVKEKVVKDKQESTKVSSSPGKKKIIRS